MSFVNRIVSILLLLVLAACGGGGGDAGTCTFGGCSGNGGGGGGGGSTPAASDLVLVLSANSVANNGTESVVATATAIDVNRNTVTGVPVTISVDNGAVATPSGTTTNTAGNVSATVGIGSDRTARTVTVTAVSGGITKKVSLAVVASTGGGGTDPSDLLLQLSAATIANSGTQTVTATVTALDAKRNVLPGVVTSITANQNATVAPTGTTTGTNGQITAAIGIGTDNTNRQITVTATAGGLTKVATLDVVNSPVQSTSAADLTLALSAATLDNGGTNQLVATATAVNAQRNTVAGIPISFTVDQSATVTPSGSATNSNGVVTGVVGIGADRSNRVITVTATSGTLTRSVSFIVTGATLTSTFAPLVDGASTGNSVEFKLVDTNSNPMPNQAITVSATGLPSASGTTDANGKFTYTYTAPSVTANTNLSITASAAGDSETVAVTVQPAGGGSVPVATQTPQSASLTPSPSVISVNQVGSTSNQVELRALFLGANNQPVKNIRVRFDLAGNANNTDGTVSWLGGNYSYSDVTGVARGTFTPGQRSSPTNGVTVRVCYATNDFDTSTCPNAVTNTLTVTSEALSVNIRTNELVAEGTAKLTYIKQFVVMVVDAAGQAKSDVLITPSVDLPAYYKGFFAWNGKVWAQNRTLATSENWSWNPTTRAWIQGAATSQPACPNEDVNRNGVREAGAFTPGGTAPGIASREEDLNWNGELDPRKADVAIKMVGSAKTDASGLAIVQIEYGKDLASWVDFVITVTASGISGSEARARYVGTVYGVGGLPFPADSVTTETSAPAFAVSPYGRGTACTNTN